MKAGKDYIGVGLGVAIFNDKGEVLLMKRGKKCYNEIGTWALIGGKLDFGETLHQGIIREVLEKIDVRIEIDSNLLFYDHILPAENQHWVAHIFTAHATSGIPKIMEPEKCDELAWFSLDNLPSPIAQMSQKALDYLTNKKPL